MKRIVQIGITIILIFLIPSGFASGQEKKEEKHIKVIVSDKGGEKVIIDSTFVTSDADGSKEIRIVKGDHIMTMDSDGGEKVVIIKSGSHSTGGESGKTMTWTEASSGEKGNVIYIKEGNGGVKDGEVKYNVEVRTDGSGNKTEKTSYVIAKDGMVVTIEGGSEEKVKELAGVIESKLGVNKDDKQVVKEETKKTTKK
jgi:hypothetical protein